MVIMLFFLPSHSDFMSLPNSFIPDFFSFNSE